jgi:hypothetical protein
MLNSITFSNFFTIGMCKVQWDQYISIQIYLYKQNSHKYIFIYIRFVTLLGFLFLGRKLHKFNASMQYVAPLMADFGAHLHDKTSIRYVDTGIKSLYIYIYI